MHFKRQFYSISLVVAFLSFAAAILSAREQRDNSAKTLTRVDDPIILEGTNFGALIGQPPGKLSLMVFSSGEWNAVPFQIDEKNPNGAYAYTHGAKAGKDPDPTLDANDELVFMVTDSGARAGRRSWPEGADKGSEIEISDPKNGKKAWTYLFKFSESAPRSNADYVRYEPNLSTKRRRVVTGQYILEGPLELVFPDLIKRIRPDGEPGPDILDRLKIRGEFVLPLDVKFNYFLDEWAKCRPEAYIDGPVRVLEHTVGYLDVGSFIKLEGEGYSITSYYDNHVIWPMYIEVPFDLRGVVKEWPVYGFMDFNSNIYGTHAFNAANPYSERLVFDGKMSEAEKNLDTTTEIDWVAGFGPQGAMVSRLPSPPEWKGVQKLFYYLDEDSVKDNPEDHPGVSGMGFRLLGFEKLGKHSTTFYLYYYYKRELEPKDVGKIIDILDHPLKIKVNPMEEPE